MVPRRRRVVVEDAAVAVLGCCRFVGHVPAAA